jgi:cytochrome c2
LANLARKVAQTSIFGARLLLAFWEPLMGRRSNLVMAAAIAVFGVAEALWAPAMAQVPSANATTPVQMDEVKKALSDPSIVSAGERSFIKCQACHMVGEKARRRVGAPLNGVVGRAAGVSEGFAYSPGMQAKVKNGLIWTVETLDDYLKTPREIVPDTSMGFAGIPKPDERKALIAYLASFADDGSRIDRATK